MQFGKVDDLSLVDFSLPPDHADTTALLQGLNKADKPQLFVGCAKWGRKDWVGKIYPKGTKEKDYLEQYGKSFNCIELNATHYRIPPHSNIEKWVNVTPDDFKFCPKIFQGISHWQRLKNTEGLTDQFLQAISGFGDKLGTIFLQLHANFGPKNMNDIADYLNSFPKDLELALEVRHPDFFSDEAAANELYQILKETGTHYIITDAAGRRDVVHMRLSTPQAFVRFVGNSLVPSDYSRIDDWIARIGHWLDEGLQTLYFFMHQHEELHSPELISYMAKKMNEELGTQVQLPEWHGENTLF